METVTFLTFRIGVTPEKAFIHVTCRERRPLDYRSAPNCGGNRLSNLYRNPAACKPDNDGGILDLRHQIYFDGLLLWLLSQTDSHTMIRVRDRVWPLSKKIGR